MPTPETTLWPIEPHTKAKHEILKRYLGAWFAILGKRNARIVYIDGFCGPGRYSGGEEGSPIIALKVAKDHRASLADEVVFWFIDNRKDRIDNLRDEVSRLPLPQHFRIKIENGRFSDVLDRELASPDSHDASPAPTFAFLDPFGFDVPYRIVQQLLRNQSCEVFITFMADFANRFKDHPFEAVRVRITELLGREYDDGLDPNTETGCARLRQVYQEQLGKAAKWVRQFEMQGRTDRTLCYLFFGTNHRLGFQRMKEAMWKVDPSGTFSFSDATDPTQTVLFGADPDLAPLESALRARFRGKEFVEAGEIRRYANEHTYFVNKHTTEVLRSLEGNERIKVLKLRCNGTERRRNSYSEGTLIRFS